jgi:hypothetical protein
LGNGTVPKINHDMKNQRRPVVQAKAVKVGDDVSNIVKEARGTSEVKIGSAAVAKICNPKSRSRKCFQHSCKTT